LKTTLVVPTADGKKAFEGARSLKAKFRSAGEE
jgi:hypothetical protein